MKPSGSSTSAASYPWLSIDPDPPKHLGTGMMARAARP